MRPAEVWGWYRYPFSSRSLIVLRIVAEDRAMANRFAIVRLPAGSAVSTYVSITASSTCRSRSVRDFGMSPNLLITNNLDRRVGAGQVADESIEAEPPLGRANQPLAPHFGPALLSPAGRGGRWRMVEGVQREPRVGAQRQVDALQFPLLGREDLLALDRGAARGDGPGVCRPRRDIPAPRAAIVAVGRGAEPDVGATRPVRRVVAGAEAVATGVRDLVKTIAASRKPRVRQQILFCIAVLFRSNDGAARDPAGEGRPLLHCEPVQRQMIGTERQGQLQVPPPVALELCGQGEDQVEREVVEPGVSERPHRPADPRRVVGTMHPRQDMVIERLGSEADPVHAGAAPGTCMFGLHVLGVGLHRYLNGVTRRRRAEGVTQRRNKGCQQIWRKQRRGTPTQVEGFETVRLGFPGLGPGVSKSSERDLLQHGLNVLLGRNALSNCDREVAVRAAAHTEGDVEVEVAHAEKLTRKSERGTRNISASFVRRANLYCCSAFRLPRSAFQVIPNRIPGSCFTSPRISSSVSAVSTALVSAPAAATSASTCFGSEARASQRERCSSVRSGG